MAGREYFEAAEGILRAEGGRPHWGKLHTLAARELAPLYPRWEPFQEIRRRLDPDGRFMSPYLEKLFGEHRSPVAGHRSPDLP
jgi:FAD/FMN-containing dehydrogenase